MRNKRNTKIADEVSDDEFIRAKSRARLDNPFFSCQGLGHFAAMFFKEISLTRENHYQLDTMRSASTPDTVSTRLRLFSGRLIFASCKCDHGTNNLTHRTLPYLGSGPGSTQQRRSREAPAKIKDERSGISLPYFLPRDDVYDHGRKCACFHIVSE